MPWWGILLLCIGCAALGGLGGAWASMALLNTDAARAHIQARLAQRAGPDPHGSVQEGKKWPPAFHTGPAGGPLYFERPGDTRPPARAE
jgi:hypothetical protein